MPHGGSDCLRKGCGTSVRHFLAYGNSDQFSFRDDTVRQSFDFMTVPGTIAAYYAEATAAFVLSSELDYLIDPRTPLYQGSLPHPRASHYALAEWLGPSVRAALGDSGSAQFPAAFYTRPVIEELVTTIVRNQRGYPSRGGQIQPKLDRYARLLAEALGREADPQPAAVEGRVPSFTLAPYFAARSLSDPWWDVNLLIWEVASRLEDAASVSPVVCVSDVRLLSDALGQVPGQMADSVFFWVPGFDEREASVEALTGVWAAVERHQPNRRLVNLYGGFYSVCLAHAGLWGFNNGLGYSESRQWPQLSATGAAPARYYVPDLHMYLSPAVAQAMVRAEPTLACDCHVCAPTGGEIVAMGYHDLKRHFAAARRWEIELVEGNDVPALRWHLRSSYERGNTASRLMPERTRPSLDYLLRWEEALSRMH